MSEDHAVERRRRDDQLTDTIELRFSEIRAELDEANTRMDSIEGKLDHIGATNELIGEHIAATCEVAQAAGVVIRPIRWVVTRLRAIIIWVGAPVAAALGAWALGERAGWW
jgi:hypothetical protein